MIAKDSHIEIGSFGTLRECSLEQGPVSGFGNLCKNSIACPSPPPHRGGELGFKVWSLLGSLGEIAILIGLSVRTQSHTGLIQALGGSCNELKSCL